MKIISKRKIAAAFILVVWVVMTAVPTTVWAQVANPLPPDPDMIFTGPNEKLAGTEAMYQVILPLSDGIVHVEASGLAGIWYGSSTSCMPGGGTGPKVASDDLFWDCDFGDLDNIQIQPITKWLTVKTAVTTTGTISLTATHNQTGEVTVITTTIVNELPEARLTLNGPRQSTFYNPVRYNMRLSGVVGATDPVEVTLSSTGVVTYTAESPECSRGSGPGLSWACNLGDIPPGGKTIFVEVTPAAITQTITVIAAWGAREPQIVVTEVLEKLRSYLPFVLKNYTYVPKAAFWADWIALYKCGINCDGFPRPDTPSEDCLPITSLINLMPNCNFVNNIAGWQTDEGTTSWSAQSWDPNSGSLVLGQNSAVHMVLRTHGSETAPYVLSGFFKNTSQQFAFVTLCHKARCVREDLPKELNKWHFYSVTLLNVPPVELLRVYLWTGSDFRP